MLTCGFVLSNFAFAISFLLPDLYFIYFGAYEQTRTADLLITNEVLYLLSYASMLSNPCC
jgi:hypothetical protein